MTVCGNDAGDPSPPSDGSLVFHSTERLSAWGIDFMYLDRGFHKWGTRHGMFRRENLSING